MGRQRHGNCTVICESSASSTTATGHTHELRGCECVNVVYGNNIYYEVHMMRTHTFCWDHTHIRLLLKQVV